MLRYLFILFALALPPVASAELQVSEAWIKNLPSSVPVRAGYLTLYNASGKAQVLRKVESPAFARIEMHRTMEQDGMMRMEPVEQLVVEPGVRVRLEPGGLHLMMMQAVNPTRPGDVIPVRLHFADGSEQAVEMTVKK